MAHRSALSVFVLTTSLSISAMEPNSLPKCGPEVRILTVVNLSEYYPAHPQCMNVPFSSEATFSVSTTGAVASVKYISISGAPDSRYPCLSSLVTDFLMKSLKLSPPSQPCLTAIKVGAK
jgi:hypothetical protein